MWEAQQLHNLVQLFHIYDMLFTDAMIIMYTPPPPRQEYSEVEMRSCVWNNWHKTQQVIDTQQILAIFILFFQLVLNSFTNKDGILGIWHRGKGSFQSEAFLATLIIFCSSILLLESIRQIQIYTLCIFKYTHSNINTPFQPLFPSLFIRSHSRASPLIVTP